MKVAQTKLFSPGKIIEARKRLWRVDSQDKNILHVTALDAAEDHARLYLPFEKVEPGKLDWPDPDRVGFPQAQELMLQAFRLSMIHSTAPLLSLQRSRAIPVDYQLVPVVMALEQSDVRLLIADDVGLGKTIEAGLVVTELMARGLAKRLLVICPASLREQWQEALEYFFHIKAEIFSRKHRRALEKDLPAGANPWEFHDAFVVSVDYAKMPRIKNQINSVHWDVVIIDEAHKVGKPHQSGPDQSVSKQRWDLGQELAYSNKIDHFLMLTATPHNGYTDSFASLLRLLDVGAVSGPQHNPNIHREIAQNHVIQRRRKDVEAWLEQRGGQSAFPDRDQDEVIVDTSQLELDVFQSVQDYGDLVIEHAEEAAGNIQTLAGWAVLHLHKRALSSPEALRQSLKNREESLRQQLEGLSVSDRGVSVEAAKANVLDEDPGELFDEEEIVRRSERISIDQEDSIRAELSALEELQAQAKTITPAKDSKLQELLQDPLRRMLNQRPKVIIFSRYRDTMDYVADQIEKASQNKLVYEDVEVITLHGGMSQNKRQEQFSAFEKAQKAVLVATDAISEGLNLQHVASQVIHYELPWNPNRLEQRNGRVDRFGQREPKVYIRTMVMDETLDASILKHLVRKAERIRADFGFSPPYFGDEANIIDFIHEHGYETTLTPRQLDLFRRTSETQKKEGPLQDMMGDEAAQRIQEESFYGQTQVSLDEVERRMKKVRETVGSAEDVERFVLSGLDKLNCTVDDNGDGTRRIVLSHKALHLPGLGEEIPQASFDPEKGLDNPEVEVLDLGHPLVRRLMDLLKTETFQDQDQGDDLNYGRTAVEYSPDVVETTAMYSLLVRYVTQTDPPQILEDIVTVGLPVYGEDPLPTDQTNKLKKAGVVRGTLTEDEKVDVLRDALEREDLDHILSSSVQLQKESLEEERRQLQQRLGEDVAWLEGADELEVGSWDLLAVKILWPA
ncbi:MAG: helicase-related protein [Candidatus Syntrophosphaera sp.]